MKFFPCIMRGGFWTRYDAVKILMCSTAVMFLHLVKHISELQRCFKRCFPNHVPAKEGRIGTMSKEAMDQINGQRAQASVACFHRSRVKVALNPNSRELQISRIVRPVGPRVI